MNKLTSDSRESFAEHHGMSIDFVNWFMDEKKDFCGDAWFIYCGAMWEGWKARDEIEQLAQDMQESEINWFSPKSVGQLISQLQTFDPETEITALQRIESHRGGKRIRQVPLSISWEPMEWPWLATSNGEGKNVLAFWAKPDLLDDGEHGELITDGQPKATILPADGGWIEWGGGSCPCDHLTPVEVRLRSGNERFPRAAISWEWQHHNDICDIIAYRVIKHEGREG